MAAAALGSAAIAQPRGFEAAVLAEFNAMRANPPRYARLLAATRSRYDGRILRGRGDGEIDIQTREGVAALDEAVAALRAAPVVPTLAHSTLLVRAARDHVAAQSRSGELGHRSNGRGPGERVVARGGGPYVSEVIGYGHSDPASAIELLLVDDGVPGRGHRHMMLGAQYRYAGTACGSHPVHRTMCVIMMSETPDGSPPPPPRRGGGAPD
ncbi:MAG: hypothetical protein C0520_11090 [Sphingopyxis sp.]|nr:hypothetical protein [Sphingopyxis sp.]